MQSMLSTPSPSADTPQRGGRGQGNPRPRARGDGLPLGGLAGPRGHSARAGPAPARHVDGHLVEDVAAAAAAVAVAAVATAAAGSSGARPANLLDRTAGCVAAARAEVVVEPRGAGGVGDVSQPGNGRVWEGVKGWVEREGEGERERESEAKYTTPLCIQAAGNHASTATGICLFEIIGNLLQKLASVICTTSIRSSCKKRRLGLTSWSWRFCPKSEEPGSSTSSSAGSYCKPKDNKTGGAAKSEPEIEIAKLHFENA